MAGTYFFHDYETFGANTRRDRPAQFAGIRTDHDFNVVGEPTMAYCRPAPDYLPDPVACLITGITPQLALEKGLREAEFAALVHAQLSQPQTCALGYNSIRFDDEITRHLLYRNLYDPYEREWRNGNSRWDLIDLVRLTYALRPEGLEWPKHPDGTPSFKLEHLTAANGLAHEAAHDALSDVYATIALAKLLKKKQPRLFEFVWHNHTKQAAAGLLGVGTFQPLLHVSEKYPASKGCLAIVVALAANPTNSNGVIVYDLSVDPTPLMTLPVAEIQRRIFTPTAELPQGVARVPLKTVHLNKSPVLAPVNALRPQDAERWGIDLPQCVAHLDVLRGAEDLPVKVRDVFAREERQANDVDLALYDGFIGDQDKARLAKLRVMDPWQLAETRPDFHDGRLPELLFRYRARNWPEALAADERARWEEFRRARLAESGLGTYRQQLDELRQMHVGDPARLAVLDDLEAYAGTLSE